LTIRIKWELGTPKAISLIMGYCSRFHFIAGTSYNVLVSAVNNSRCPDAPCSEYGIKQKKLSSESHFVNLPVNPNLNVESVDCNYMFGCQYQVIVETSNAMVRRSARVYIPRKFPRGV